MSPFFNSNMNINSSTPNQQASGLRNFTFNDTSSTNGLRASTTKSNKDFKNVLNPGLPP